MSICLQRTIITSSEFVARQELWSSLFTIFWFFLFAGVLALFCWFGYVVARRKGFGVKGFIWGFLAGAGSLIAVLFVVLVILVAVQSPFGSCPDPHYVSADEFVEQGYTYRLYSALYVEPGMAFNDSSKTFVCVDCPATVRVDQGFIEFNFDERMPISILECPDNIMKIKLSESQVRDTSLNCK